MRTVKTITVIQQRRGMLPVINTSAIRNPNDTGWQDNSHVRYVRCNPNENYQTVIVSTAKTRRQDEMYRLNKLLERI